MANNQQSPSPIKSGDEMNGPREDEAVSEAVTEMDHPRSPQGVDECGMYGITRCSPTVDVSLERLGICPRQDVAHPSFTTLESRMESFSTWPLHIKLRPEELSDAGFFYTGVGDRTICFQCSGGLKDWEENDEPWKEHARYFSKCTYLIQKKGRDFIDEVLGKKSADVRTFSQDPQMHMPTATTSSFNGNSLVRKCGSDEGSSGYYSGGSFGEEPGSQENAAASSFGAQQCLSDVGSSGYSSGGSFAEEHSGSSSQELKTKKNDKPLDDQRACKICYAEEVGVVFLPCGHLVSCVNCAPSLKTCAVCRKPFSATVRAYLS